MGQPTPVTLTGWGQWLGCWICVVIKGWWSPPVGRLGIGGQIPAPGARGPCSPRSHNRQRRLFTPDLLLSPCLPSGGDGISPLQE